MTNSVWILAVSSATLFSTISLIDASSEVFVSSSSASFFAKSALHFRSSAAHFLSSASSVAAFAATSSSAFLRCESSRAETAASTFASNSAFSSCSVFSLVITLLSKVSVLIEVITHSVENNSTECLPHFDSDNDNETSGIPGFSPSRIDISLKVTSIGVDIQSPPSG